MTDQQDAPLCPHGHGPMQEMEWGQGPYYIAWRCVDPTCGAIGEAFLLEQEYQRGRKAERYELRRSYSLVWARDAQFNWFYINHGGVFTPMPNPINDAVSAERQRAEAAEARVREQRDDLLALQTRILEVETERDRLREALESIHEYWNGAETQMAMSDALDFILGRARGALTCPRCGNPLPDCQCYGSKAMAEDYRQPQDEAPHSRCWCGSHIVWGCDGAYEGWLCTKGHKPCPGCGQWVEWAKRAGWYDHRPGADAMPCPGPASHGCPKCKEEPHDARE